MLKRKLIRHGIISIVVLTVLAGGGMLLSNYDDDTQAEKQSKENQNAAMRGEHDSIVQQLGSGFEVSSFYDAYVKNHSDNLTLKRETATQWMSDLHEKNHLTNLSVIISPITDATVDIGQLHSGIMVKSDVHVSFGGVTDNSIYGFIEGLERKMPGMMVIRELKFTSTAELSRASLLALTQHRPVSLMSGEISFSWLGIRPQDDSKTSTIPNGQANGSR